MVIDSSGAFKVFTTLTVNIIIISHSVNLHIT